MNSLLLKGQAKCHQFCLRFTVTARKIRNTEQLWLTAKVFGVPVKKKKKKWQGKELYLSLLLTMKVCDYEANCICSKQCVLSQINKQKTTVRSKFTISHAFNSHSKFRWKSLNQKYMYLNKLKISRKGWFYSAKKFLFWSFQSKPSVSISLFSLNLNIL